VGVEELATWGWRSVPRKNRLLDNTLSPKLSASSSGWKSDLGEQQTRRRRRRNKSTQLDRHILPCM